MRRRIRHQARAAALPASGSASAADGVSHLKIMGTEGWAPCTDWNEVGEYSAFKTLQGWLDEAKLDVEWEVITAEQYPVILQTRLASRQRPARYRKGTHTG